MKNRRRKKGEHNLQYNLMIWKKNNAFDILNDIDDDLILVQLMYSIGIVSRAISTVWY